MSSFNFRGTDQQKPVGKLSGGERNRVHLAKLLRSGGNVLLLDEPTTVLEGDVVAAVRALKATDGPDLQLGCGADLLATLSQAGLVDTYRLLITTTVLGQGKAMFASFREPLSLRLTGTRTFASGSVLLEYEPLHSPPPQVPSTG